MCKFGCFLSSGLGGITDQTCGADVEEAGPVDRDPCTCPLGYQGYIIKMGIYQSYFIE